MEVEVAVSGWEIECCEPPPGEGDRVVWPLTWVEDPLGPGSTEVSWRPHPPGGGVTEGLLLEHGPLVAWWDGIDLGAVPSRGRLVAQLHGGLMPDVPRVTGTVVGVHVITRAYRRPGSRGYEPVPGDFALRAVTRAPKWFHRRSGRDEYPDVDRRDDGVLVRLALDGPRG